jgi:hypothetical protein
MLARVCADDERTIHHQDRLMAQLQAQLLQARVVEAAEGAGGWTSSNTSTSTSARTSLPRSYQPQLPMPPSPPPVHRPRPGSAVSVSSSTGVVQHGMLFADGASTPQAQLSAGLAGALRSTRGQSQTSATGVADAVALVATTASSTKQLAGASSPVATNNSSIMNSPVVYRVAGAGSGSGGTAKPPMMRSSSTLAGTLGSSGTTSGLLWEPEAAPSQRHSSRPVSAVGASAKHGSPAIGYHQGGAIPGSRAGYGVVMNKHKELLAVLSAGE